MGCDIHGWVEKKVGEKWVAVAELEDRSRNYRRFARLAGVRGEGPAPKGMPADASDTARLTVEEYGSDGHSHSHMDLLEAFAIFRDTAGTLGGPDHDYSIWNAFGFCVDAAESCPTCGHVKSAGDSGYRLVFWFDN